MKAYGLYASRYRQALVDRANAEMSYQQSVWRAGPILVVGLLFSLLLLLQATGDIALNGAENWILPVIFGAVWLFGLVAFLRSYSMYDSDADEIYHPFGIILSFFRFSGTGITVNTSVFVLFLVTLAGPVCGWQTSVVCAILVALTLVGIATLLIAHMGYQVHRVVQLQQQAATDRDAAQLRGQMPFGA